MHNKPHTDEARAKMSAALRGKAKPWKHRPTIEVDGVLLYRCGACHRFLPRESFYANRRTLLGIKSECKACHSAGNIRSRDRDAARDRNRAYMARARAADPERFRLRERLRARRVDEKVLARRVLNSALRRGKVVRPDSCSACAVPGRVEAHHDDYSQPLRVHWLCSLCHGKEHRHG